MLNKQSEACAECGIAVSPRCPSHRARVSNVFCSRVCFSAYQRRTRGATTRPCGNCGRPFRVYKSKPNARYCSQACYGEAARRDHGKVVVRCPWLNCASETSVYRSQIIFGKTRSKTTRCHVFCAEHRALVRRVTGSARMNGYGRVFANPSRVYAGRSGPEALRVASFILHGERCNACRLPLVFAEHGRSWWMDHTVPVYKGGLTTLSNFAPLCDRCHRTKTSAEIHDVRRQRRRAYASQCHWLTHAQKDRIIADLQREVAELRAASAPEEATR